MVISKLVVFNLGHGDLRLGFPVVTVQILPDDNSMTMVQFTGSLPAAPEIIKLNKIWQFLYQSLYQNASWHFRGKTNEYIEIDEEDVTQFSESEFTNLCHELKIKINAWLSSEPFRRSDQQLRRQLNASEEIRIVIETNDDQLQRLPWFLWNFFEDYTKAEIAISAQEFEQFKSLPKTTRNHVKILAIIGNSQGIDVQKDQLLLEQLPNASLTILVEPQRKQLNDHLWEQGWDILFFAGHSKTEGRIGRIYINKTDSLTIDELRYALKTAIARGLQVAIFNSCDGLGLGRDLSELNIPQMIVMRESVPDKVTQEFLKYFLTAFARGDSFYMAVRSARERLQGLEDKFPCASWLPMIYQNPAVVAPTWQELCGRSDRHSLLNRRIRPTALLIASVVITSLVMGIRQMGILQSWELQAYDQLMRLRPDEGPDSRLLLVTITEADIQAQNPKHRRGSSLSDATLAQLLNKLDNYQPQVIGLDIYRDFPVASNYANLATSLRQDERFVAICQVGQTKDNPASVPPPPEIPEERLGFSDVVEDNDNVIRRHLVGMTPVADCGTKQSFSLRVAHRYLKEKKIYSRRPTPVDNLQIGDLIFKKLRSNSSFYQKLDDRGYQVLLNYRSTPKVAQQVTLADILNDKLNPNLVQNRIVLIGVTAKSVSDDFLTPYSAGEVPIQKMPGVVVHAHMVSQIISAVLDRRPLLWWWSPWGEILWVWSWSLVGGVLVCLWRSPLQLGLAGGAVLGSLYSLCFVLLLKGGCVPLVPSALALVATGGSVVVYTTASQVQRFQQTFGVRQ